METGWIVAIVLGSILAIVVIVVIIVWVHSAMKKKKMMVEEHPEPKKSKYNHEKWDNLLKSIEKHQQKEVHYQAI